MSDMTTLPNLFPSPDISTADILNASSIGWSPQRSPTKASFANFNDHCAGQEDGEVPTSPSAKMFNPDTLRSHAYVSNSVFKNQSPDAKAQQGQFSGAGRSATATGGQKMGVGLGIGVDGSATAGKSAGAFTPVRRVNPQDAAGTEPTSPRGCHPSAMAPRQTRGFEALTKSSYVSNSPFKQGVSNSDSADIPTTRPLSFSTSPSKAQSRASSQQPTTPTSQRSYAAGSQHDVTPRGSQAQRTPTRQSADGKRGLLTSNRMHGPRQMSGSYDSPRRTGPADENERRKTVTFDEEPDVQEFDRESSFDGSIRSSESHLAMRNHAPSLRQGLQLQKEDEDTFWQSGRSDENGNHRLSVANGSDVASSPDLSDNDGRQGASGSSVSSTGSPDFSETDASDAEAATPPLGQYTAANVSSNSLGGLQRVDSLVDELLQDEILTKATPVQNKRLSLHESSIYGVDESYEMPIRRGAANGRPAGADNSHPFLPGAQPNRVLPAGGLPSLPNWSPLMMDDKSLSAFTEAPSSPTKVPPSPRRPGGRPHISRDAVLERVAKEKKAQAEAERKASAEAPQVDASIPASNTLSDVTGKSAASSSTSGMRPAQSMEIPIARPPLFSKTSLETKREPEPRAFAKQQHVASASPLDKLGEQMAKEALTKPAAAPVLPVTKPTEESDWFASPNVSKDDDKEKTHAVISTPADALKLPGSSSDLQCPPSPTGSARSGRLSPSKLGPAPAPISQDDYADKIIARRRSKQGLGRRSASFGATSPLVGQTASNSQMLVTQSAPGEASSGSASLESERSRQDVQADLHKSKEMLDGALKKAVDNGFESGMSRDISRIFREGDLPYKISDRGTFAGVNDKISHSKLAGDVDSGKAWKRIRRPSDLNEHAEEMKALRANENPKKASGRVFVMVDSFHPANLPVPTGSKTQFFCILDNGLHVVKTGLSTLKPGQGAVSSIAQEFELIQHKNLEFSLTLFAQKDAHLQEKAAPATPSKREKHGSVTKSFMSKLLRSPKKDKSAGQEKGEPMLSFMNREGAFGRVNLVFEPIASKCLGKCLTVDLPVKGVAEPASSVSGHSTISSVRSADFSRNLSQSRGILRLKVFYLPPMPNVPKNLLPENIKECVAGIEQAKWHQAESRLMGTLTQSGGDCSTWRRRPVKAQGSSLICFNEVTQKPVVKIDLSKAIKIQEAWDPCDLELSSTKGRDGSRAALVTKYNINEEPDESYHVARSFRIVFADEEKIYFFADTDKEKEQWLEVIADMIHTKRPPNPAWARLCLEAIKSHEAAKETAKSTAVTTATSSTTSAAAKAASAPKSTSKAAVTNKPLLGASTGGLPASTSKKTALNTKSMQMPPTVPEETSTPQSSVSAATAARKPAVQGSLNGQKPIKTTAATPASSQARKPSTSAGTATAKTELPSYPKRPASSSAIPNPSASASRIPVGTSPVKGGSNNKASPPTTASNSTPFTPVRKSSVALGATR